MDHLGRNLQENNTQLGGPKKTEKHTKYWNILHKTKVQQ